MTPPELEDSLKEHRERPEEAVLASCAAAKRCILAMRLDGAHVLEADGVRQAAH